VGDELLDHGVPFVDFQPLRLFLLGRLLQFDIVEPPRRAGLESDDGFGPKLVSERC
jgi:hypothetical protein